MGSQGLVIHQMIRCYDCFFLGQTVSILKLNIQLHKKDHIVI